MQQCEIQPGETLVSISIREKVSVVALRRLNKLYGNEIFPGQILSLRPIPAQRIASESCSAVDLFFDAKRGTSDIKSCDVATTVPSVHLAKTDSHSPALDVSNSVKGPTLVGNILDAKSAIATSASEKLSAIRSLISTRRIQIEEPDNFNRERSTSDASVASLSISYTEKKALYDKDELEKPLPTLLGNSSILTPEYAKKLRRFLPSMQQIENWRLLYSVLKDGADLNSFFRKTKNNKYTVIIVETINGELFGGFSSKEWITSPNFYGSGESFLFKFDSNKEVEHYPWAGSESNNFFVWSSCDQIAMGGGGDGFGFVLDSDFATGESFKCKTYGNPVLVDKENGSFRIANVECWGFEGLFNKGNKSSQFQSESSNRNR